MAVQSLTLVRYQSVLEQDTEPRVAPDAFTECYTESTYTLRHKLLL